MDKVFRTRSGQAGSSADEIAKQVATEVLKHLGSSIEEFKSLLEFSRSTRSNRPAIVANAGGDSVPESPNVMLSPESVAQEKERATRAHQLRQHWRTLAGKAEDSVPPSPNFFFETE